MSAAKTSNREKAPIAAAFVDEMRAVFGDVKVLYVKEGDVLLGEKQPEGAPCLSVLDAVKEGAEADREDRPSARKQAKRKRGRGELSGSLIG